MADHAKYVTLAKRLIQANGRQIRLQLLAQNGTDPSKPWRGNSSDDIANEYDAVAVFIPAIGRELGTLVTDTEMLKRSTHVCICEPVAEDLEEKVTRIQDSDNLLFRVIWSQALKPADKTVLYVFGLAR